MLCREKAKEYVKLAKGAGTILTVVPAPFMATNSLMLLESTLVYWIGRIYGEELNKTTVASIIENLDTATLAKKVGIMELLNLGPAIGWLFKPALANQIIDTLTDLAIQYFEKKHPNMEYTTNTTLEEQMMKKRTTTDRTTTGPRT